MANGTCSIEGCTKDAHSLGWCRTHYMRYYRHGDPLIVHQHGSRWQTVAERFWAKVNKNGPVPERCPELGPCWLWDSTLYPNGYGCFVVDGHRKMAHRIAYELIAGPIPEGYEPDHLCKVHACVNPGHLEAVTHRENLMRSVGPSALNAAKTHCDKGHEFTRKNTRVRRGKGGAVWRECKTCGRDQAVARARAAGQTPPPDGFRTVLAARNASKTHCPNDHEYTPENTIIEKTAAGRPARRCRTCRTEQRAAYYARKRTAA